MSNALKIIKDRIGLTQEGKEAVVLYTALDEIQALETQVASLDQANEKLKIELEKMGKRLEKLKS